ncbi:MAG: Zn-dependent hydrolase [Candidatus Micrarchaeia archaeon]
MLRIRQERITHDLASLSKIGRSGRHAVTRLAFTGPEDAAFLHMAKRMRDAGLDVRVDSFGNLYGRFEGRDKNANPVLVGSHIDTVRQGGRFDGTAGVVAGLEAIRAIGEAGHKPAKPIELVVFRGEESSRFGKALLGSKAATGQLSENDLDTIGRPMASLGHLFKTRGQGAQKTTPLDASNTHAYLELHIEQGKMLELAGKQVGVVTEIAAPVRYELSFKGQADHSGATPMGKDRSDALVAAAKTAVAAEKYAKRENRAAWLPGRKGMVVATMGKMDVPEGSMNTVPGSVEALLDIRGTNLKKRGRAEKRILGAARDAAAKRGVLLQETRKEHQTPVKVSKRLADDIARACTEEKITFMKMPSGAGHDAVSLSQAGIPVGMIFVPSKKGISHAAEEYTAPRDIAAGTAVLARALLSIANK